MWSDDASAAAAARLCERLRSLLPLPASPPARRSRPLALPGDPGPAEVAAALRGQPGFVWLDGGPASGHRLYARPLLRLAAADGRIRARRGAGERRFAGSGFDLLAAAFRAWPSPGGGGHGLQLAG